MSSKRLTAQSVARIKAEPERFEVADGGSTDGLRMIVHPTGRKVWAMRFRRPDGRPAKLTLGPVDVSDRRSRDGAAMGQPLTLAEARRLATEVKRQRAMGVDVVARRLAPADGDSFLAVARAFVLDHRASGKRTTATVARTLGLDAELAAIPGGLAERWGRRAIGSITAHDIHDTIEESVARGIPGHGARVGKSEARGRKIAGALGAMFKWASRHRRSALDSNPCAGVYRPGPPPSRDRVLNWRSEVRGADELRAFWAAAGEMGRVMGPLLRLLLLTGCRLREVSELTWDESTDDHAEVHLARERTKNWRPHVVYLSPLAREVLSTAPRIEASRYVFSTSGRRPVSDFSKMKRRLDVSMTRRLGKLLPWRVLDLRRTCATGMAGLGVAVHVIESALNHVSGARAGVAGTYNRELYASERRSALELWSSHIARVVGADTQAGHPASKSRQRAAAAT